MLLENRNKNLTNLHKAADYISRCLRENYKVFSVESTENKVQFLSENNNLITCNYGVKDTTLNLTNLEMDTVDNYLSVDRVDGVVAEGISSFVNDLRENRFDKADTSFSDVLNLFESRNNLDTLRYKFEKHQDSFTTNTSINETSEFKKMQEAKENLKAFVVENKEEILGNEDIANSIGIANAMSKVFETAQEIDKEYLENNKSLAIDLTEGNNLYEMVCQQELMRQELIESKEDFSGAWMTSESLQKLSSCIFSDEQTLQESIAAVIEEVPYFSFATKSDLNEVFTSIYEVNSTDTILKKDVKAFVSKIYEAKKPVKEKLVELLSEKYGVNVANLKFVPTFSNLAKTQSVFFEVLSMCMEEGILQDVTSDFSKMLKGKGGVEVLDVNDIIKECTDTETELEENMLIKYVDVPRLTKDLGSVIDVLGTLTYTDVDSDEGDAKEEMAPEKEEEAEAPMEEPMEEPAKEEGEDEPVGDDADSEVGMGGDNSPVEKIMADLNKMLGALGGEDKDMPEDQYGA